MLFIINSILFSLLAVIWTKKDWLNFFVKTVFIVVTIANVLYALQAYGYIVKIVTQ